MQLLNQFLSEIVSFKVEMVLCWQILCQANRGSAMTRQCIENTVVYGFGLS